MANQVLHPLTKVENDKIFDDYSTAYDLMLKMNPAYQLLLRQFKEELLALNLDVNTPIKVLDIGAGTGNFSKIIQKHFPLAQIHFLEPNKSMTEYATSKLDNSRLVLINRDFQRFKSDEEFDLIICIHALYLMKNPKLQIPKIKYHLKKSGTLLLCDIGKTINVVDWSIYIYGSIFLKQGYRKMKESIQQTIAIKEANTIIQNNQKKGLYWKHNLKQLIEFLSPFFTIQKAFNTYRNHSRFIVAKFKD